MQLLSASPIEPVASSTNITFSDWALPPALAADAVGAEGEGYCAQSPSGSRSRPSAVCVTETTLGLVALQAGRFDVDVTHDSVGVELVRVRCDIGFAVFQFVIAVATLVELAVGDASA